MKTKRTFKAIAVAMALTMAVSLSPGRAYALPSDSVGSAVQQQWSSRQQDESRVRGRLAEADVRQKLARLGLSPSDIETSLARLSDAETHELAAQLDRVQSGGFHGAVIAVAIIAAIVLAVWFIIDHHHSHTNY